MQNAFQSTTNSIASKLWGRILCISFYFAFQMYKTLRAIEIKLHLVHETFRLIIAIHLKRLDLHEVATFSAVCKKTGYKKDKISTISMTMHIRCTRQTYQKLQLFPAFFKRFSSFLVTFSYFFKSFQLPFDKKNFFFISHDDCVAVAICHSGVKNLKTKPVIINELRHLKKLIFTPEICEKVSGAAIGTWQLLN